MPPPDALLHDFARALSAVPELQSQATVDQAAILVADHLVLADGAADPGSPMERAAQNAARASATDRDDVHWGRLVHPGAVIWATTLELGASASGRGMLRAASIGYEAMTRLAAVFPAGARGPYHLTALTAGVGAAAAASVLLSPDGAVSPDALGHALSVAGGSSGAIAEFSGTRSFHRGHAVRTGIGAALAAAAGVGSTQRDLERGGGVLGIAEVDPAALLDGEPRALLDSSVRVFPTAGWFQCAYEAARTAAGALAASGGGRITGIRVVIPAGIAARSVSGQHAINDPWNSLETAAALGAIAGGASGTAARLAALVTVEADPDPSTPTGAMVEVRASGAEPATAFVGQPLGHPDRPAPIAELANTWGLAAEDARHWLAEIRRTLDSDLRIAEFPTIPARRSSP